MSHQSYVSLGLGVGIISSRAFRPGKDEGLVALSCDHLFPLQTTRLAYKRGFTIYGYGEIVRRLARCAPPMKTARAIKRSSWCGGCSGGRYVTGLIRTVKRNFEAYAARSIATAL